MMNAEEMQSKISDYERKRVRYERMIGRLQDDLFDRDMEILRAKFTLLNILPELNLPDLDPYVNIKRIPGYLDKEIFKRACLEESLRDPSKCHDEEQVRKEKAENYADTLHTEWKRRFSMNWMLYINHGEEERTLVERPEILDVKEKYGDELYYTIKKAWFERREFRRTGVTFKPWNYAAGREQTLTELLDPLGEKIDMMKFKVIE